MSYKFCNQIYNHLCFNREYVSSCTVGNNSKGQCIPVIIDYYTGEKIDWEKFFDERDNLRENSKKGIYPERCEGCQYFTEDEWDYSCSDRKFKYIQFSHWQRCNSDCIYCENHTKYSPFDKKPDTYDSVPILRELTERGYVSEQTEYDFAGGEPTMYYKFNELLDLLTEIPIKSIIVHSNVIKYSKQIEKCIKQGKLNLCVSVDAGSKDVHEKVKRVKSFDVVWKNIRKYAKAKNSLTKNFISLKYIIIPELNDSEKEIMLFIERAMKSGIDKLILNADNNIFRFDYSDDIRRGYFKRVTDLSEFFVAECRKRNLKYELEYNIRHIYFSSGLKFPSFDY